MRATGRLGVYLLVFVGLFAMRLRLGTNHRGNSRHRERSIRRGRAGRTVTATLDRHGYHAHA